MDLRISDLRYPGLLITSAGLLDLVGLNKFSDNIK